MTEHTISPRLRWQTLFVLFHYLFSLLFFSLPAHALNSGESGSLSNVATTEASPLRDQMAQFWGSAQHSNASDAARGVANSAVNSALTAEVEDWLNLGGGKAKVTLDTGISGNHNRDIGVDYFWPLLDTENSTLFTQLSFHRWNDRNQVNVGLGYRHDLNEHWMAGGNLFYDRDLSRRHNRLGVGGELWGEGLRTALNYYHPLSDWRLSHDNTFNDDPLFYDLYERAARGWDLSVETAISQHVGVKGTWFQWYGDKVDVTGARSQASRDPHGVTLGANWQPVPLLAFNADHSVISGQDDDTRLGLNLNWQFGKTLAQMLDPAAASALSSLKGARHDFVNRNNNIVLAYQQREKNLHLYFEPTSLTTKAGSTPFTHAVKGGRGGFIVYHSNQPDIAQVVNEQAGTVASLRRGEVIISAEEYQDASRQKLYDRAEYRLTIQPGDFAPSVTEVRIEGEAAIGSTLNGSYTWISNEGEDEGKTVQRWYRQHAPEDVLSTSHQYQQTAADVGRTLVYEVTPVNKAGLRGQPGSAQQDGPQLTLNNLEMALLQGGGEQQANGQIRFKAGETGMLLFEATVLDQDGKPVADQPVYWSHSNPNLGKLDETRQMTNSKGQSLVKFSDITRGGDDVIVASLLPEAGVARTLAAAENTHTKTLPLSISFSTLSNVTIVNPPQKVTVGANTDFTVLVTDEEHQALENVSLQITSQGDTRTHNTGKDGKATFTLTAPLSTDPAQWTVSAVLTENSEKGDQAQIGLLADSASAQVIRLIANPSTAVVGAKVVLTASVRDKHGNPLPGAEVAFLSAATDGTLLTKQATNEEGVAAFPDYSQTEAQEFHPAARVGAGPLKATTVTFTADKVKTLTLQPNFSGELLADGSTVSWTATAKDAHNNPVPEAALLWNVIGPTGKITPEKDDITNDKGQALVTFALPQTQGNLKVEVASGNAKQQDNVPLSPVLMLAALEPSSNQPLVGSQITLTARVTNLTGDPLENVLVDFTNNQNARMTEKSGVRTDINGLAQAALEIVQGQEQGAAGDYEVKATLAAKPSENKTTTVSWQIDNAAARVTQLHASPGSALVGSKVQLTATVKDTFGNPVKGAQVEFLSAAGKGAVLATLPSNEQGLAVWDDYSQTIAQVYQPAARVVDGAAQETRVTFTAEAVASLTLTPDFNGDLLADGVTEASWTVTAQDKYQNRVPQAALTWQVSGPGGDISPQKKDEKTQANGTGQVTVVLPQKHGALRLEVASGAEKTEDSVLLQPVLTLKSLTADNPYPRIGGQVTMTAQVTNLAGDPLENVLVDFTNSRNSQMTEQRGVKTNASGVSEAILLIIAGQELGAAGHYDVTATLPEKTSETKTETVTWQVDTADAKVTELQASPTSTEVGSKVQLTATVQDAFGNRVSNAQVEFLSAAANGDVLTTLATNDQGVVTYADYSQKVATSYYPAARVVGGTAMATRVTFNPGAVKTLELQPDFTGDLQADGSSQASWTVTAQDAHGNLVPDAALSWEIIGPTGNLTPSKDDKTNAQGKGRSTVTLPGEQGELKITVKSGNAQDDDSVTLLPVLKLQSLVPDTDQPVVGGSVTLTAKVVNQAGTALANVMVNFTHDHKGVMETAPNIKTDRHGEAKATLKILTGKELGAPGNYIVEATLQDKTSEYKQATVSWLPGTGQVTTLTANPTAAAVGTDVQLTATVQDQFGNKVHNAAVNFLDSVAGSPLGDAVNSDAQGVSTFTYQQPTAGAYRPAALVGNNGGKDTPVSFWGTPSIESVSVTPEGGVVPGTALTATPQGFNAQGTGEDDSRYQWYYRRGSQEWQQINKATDKIFAPTASYVGLKVRAGVKPKGSQQIIEGEEKYSDAVSVYGTPSIESVSVTPAGDAQAGATLTATLKGFDAQGTGEDSSTYQWYYRKGSNTDWKAINGATGKTFPTLTSNAGMEIRVVVTPKGSLSEVEGVPKESNAVQLYGKPTITAVAVTPHGSVRVNNPLTATWQGFNAQGTGEDASRLQWYYRESTTAGWIAIDKANGKAYTPDNVRIGQQVRVGVTPKGSDQAVEGTEIYSDPISVYSMPSIQSVTVTPSGSVAQSQTLTATINGFNAQGTGNNASLYQWYSRPSSDQGWTKIDKAEQQTFALGNIQPGAQVRVGVTPKGSEQVITGVTQYSDAVSVYGKPSIASVTVAPGSTVAPNRALTATINGFNAQGTGSNASTWQWYWRGPGDSKWTKAGRFDATQQVFTPDASYDGYEVLVGVTPKGSEQAQKGDEVFSNVVKIQEPVTYKITRIKHYYFNNFVAPWVYEPVVKVENNKGQPVSGVEICFKIYRGSIPMPDGVPTLPSQADMRKMTGSDGVTEIERVTGSGTQKVHFRAWICSTNKLPTSSAYMGGGNKDWYDAPTDWQTVVSAN